MEFKIGRSFRFTRVNKLLAFLTKLIKKIFSPITRSLDEIDNNYNEQSAIKKTLVTMFILRVPICVSVLLIMVCAAFVFASLNKYESSAQMSFNYEESAKGLNPNATRLNIYEIKSQDVVEKMLYYCGIDAADVDMDKLIDSITVRPASSKGFKAEDYYIATSYKISVKKPAEIKSVSSQDLLKFLCKSYTDVFYNRYAENRSVLDFDADDFEDMEFLLIADLLDVKAQQQSKYLNMRVKQSKTFTDDSSDATFKSLAEQVDDFRAYDIEEYRSYVLQTGIAHNKVHYLRVLDYVNLVNGVKYDKDMAAYNVIYDGIALYNEAMISIVMIPTIDRETSNYYMSKTKTGMDYMASEGDKHLAAAQGTAKKIQTNSDIIYKMLQGKNTDENISKAYKMIKNMQTKFSEMSRQIEMVDKAYIKYKTKDYITFKISGASFMQKIRPDILLMLAFVFIGGVFALAWIRFRYFSGGDNP